MHAAKISAHSIIFMNVPAGVWEREHKVVTGAKVERTGPYRVAELELMYWWCIMPPSRCINYIFDTPLIHKDISPKMARFNITIPDSIAKKLDEDAGNQNIPRSTLIAQHIEQHYEGKSEADIDAEIARLRTESTDIVQRARIEHEKKVQHLVATHEAELQQVRADYEKKIEQITVDSAAATQQLEEDVERLELISEKYKTDLISTEERNASAVERLRQSEASKNTVVTGLQHENELLKQQVAHLETLLQTEKSLSSELRRDKETMQKQLELVTLRLPEPKVGFWARLSSGGRKQED